MEASSRPSFAGRSISGLSSDERYALLKLVFVVLAVAQIAGVFLWRDLAHVRALWSVGFKQNQHPFPSRTFIMLSTNCFSSRSKFKAYLSTDASERRSNDDLNRQRKDDYIVLLVLETPIPETDRLSDLISDR